MEWSLYDTNKWQTVSQLATCGYWSPNTIRKRAKQHIWSSVYFNHTLYISVKDIISWFEYDMIILYFGEPSEERIREQEQYDRYYFRLTHDAKINKRRIKPRGCLANGWRNSHIEWNKRYAKGTMPTCAPWLRKSKAQQTLHCSCPD